MKTKLWTVVLTVMVLAVATTGCSNDSESLNDFGALPDMDTEVPLQIVGGSISADVQTRATITSGNIGVFRATVNNYTALYNVQYRYDEDWKADSSDNAIYLNQQPATLYAYYPYGSVNFTIDTFDAMLTAQAYDNAKDMCYATTGGDKVCNETPNATFAMTRAYSRVQLSIKRHATNYGGTGLVSNINFKNGGTFYSSRTLNIADGSFGSTPANDWAYEFNTIIAAGEVQSVDLLVPPQPVGSGLTITLTLDGKDRSVTVPADKFTSNNLAAGKIYKIGLAISAAQIDIDGAVEGDDYGNQGNTDYELSIYAVEVDDYGSQENADFEVKV